MSEASSLTASSGSFLIWWRAFSPATLVIDVPWVLVLLSVTHSRIPIHDWKEVQRLQTGLCNSFYSSLTAVTKCNSDYIFLDVVFSKFGSVKFELPRKSFVHLKNAFLFTHCVFVYTRSLLPWRLLILKAAWARPSWMDSRSACGTILRGRGSATAASEGNSPHRWHLSC